jgi:uncharacterized membrane protein
MTFHPVPQPEDLSAKEKDDAMGGYLMMFAAWGAGLPLPMLGVLASIIYYYVNRGKGRFVQFHAHQSMMSQVVIGLMNASLVFWFVYWWWSESEGPVSHEFVAYALLVGLANLLYVVASILAAMGAYRGRMVYFWFFGRLAYAKVFAETPEKNQATPVNRPPTDV